VLAQKPYLRWSALGALLLGEYLLISFSFDAFSLRERAGWGFIGFLGILAPLAVVTAAALWLLYGPRLRDELTHVLAAARERTWPYLLAHLAAFAAFYLCTARVFASDAALNAGWVATIGRA
jgi:hypothetical protein